MPRENITLQKIKKPPKKSEQEKTASYPGEFYRPSIYLSSEQVDLPEGCKPGDTIYIGIVAKVQLSEKSENDRGKDRASMSFAIHEVGFDKKVSSIDDNEDERPITKAYDKAEQESNGAKDDDDE